MKSTQHKKASLTPAGKRKVALRSPLRYPGGKTRAASKIVGFFPPGIGQVCSPFLGGGSIEIELAKIGVKVFGYDIFQPIANFWKLLLADSKKLAKIVREYYPLTRSRFYSLQAEFGKIRDEQEQAAIFFALNRASFSGTTLSGGMSPGHPRFNEAAIQRLEEFKLENFRVECADFKDSLKKHESDFLYLDPPYANGEKLYGERGSTQKGFDHEGLATIIKKRGGWLLSYNDHPKVYKWYEGFKIVNLSWTYGMNKSKVSNEILVLSKDIKQL